MFNDYNGNRIADKKPANLFFAMNGTQLAEAPTIAAIKRKSVN